MPPEAMEGLHDDIDELQDALLLAKKRVRYLEALIRARRPCVHDWVMFHPGGQRDNGEYYYRCTRCGNVSS